MQVEKDKKAIDEIFYSFKVIATNINQQIKNKYSNYYKNSDPINNDVNNVNMIIRFIDLEAISWN